MVGGFDVTSIMGDARAGMEAGIAIDAGSGEPSGLCWGVSLPGSLLLKVSILSLGVMSVPHTVVPDAYEEDQSGRRSCHILKPDRQVRLLEHGSSGAV